MNYQKNTSYYSEECFVVSGSEYVNTWTCRQNCGLLSCSWMMYECVLHRLHFLMGPKCTPSSCSMTHFCHRLCQERKILSCFFFFYVEVNGRWRIVGIFSSQSSYPRNRRLAKWQFDDCLIIVELLLLCVLQIGGKITWRHMCNFRYWMKQCNKVHSQACGAVDQTNDAVSRGSEWPLSPCWLITNCCDVVSLCM
jgi:hypothetical protein